MISIEESRSGEPTAKIENRYLHSRYSPRSEASGFYDRFNLERYSTFIIIEPGFNYLSDLILEKNPDARIISIHFLPYFRDIQPRQNESKFLFEENPDELIRFLKSELSELDMDGLKLLEWPASMHIFIDKTRIVSRVVSQTVRELYGNITTVSGFGKKSFLNTIRNYLLCQKKLVFSVPENAPVVITGSGPGLAENLELIKNYRNFFILAALPSSVRFLRINSIVPDLIVSTDPGYYASIHLFENNDIPVAAPFSANLTPAVLANGIIPISQNSFIDSVLFRNESHYFSLPSNGTVAGSALFLASVISKGPVFLCGLDFSFIGSSSHVRPHTFDTLIESFSGRTDSITSLYFKRNIVPTERLRGPRRTSMQLKTYAGWFESISSMFSNRVFFLNHFQDPPGDFKSVGSTFFSDMLNSQVIRALPFSEITDYEENRKNIIAYLSVCRTELIHIEDQIKNCSSNSEIFKLVNHDIIFNLYLPELLEFKKHFLSGELEPAREKALDISRKATEYLEGINV